MNGTDNPNNSLFGINTDRGFTGHEHLDEIALIHMNGRIYDPVIARFMTPDPHLQDAHNLQAYNRYSYVLNNPLMYVDPSGYLSFKSVFRFAFAVAAAIFVPQLVAPLLEAAAIAAGAAAAAPTVVTVGGGVLGGFAAGLIASGGDFQAGVLGGITGGLFSVAGSFTVPGIERIAAPAAVGCVTTALGGGSCGAGALSAGVAKFAGGKLDGIGGLNDLGRGIAVTVIGGTASVIGGGKFENGAVTAAFGYLFNEISCGRGQAVCRGRNVTRGELNEHGRTGGGRPVIIPGAEVDLSYIAPEDFPMPGQIAGMPARWSNVLSVYNPDMSKFGSVTGLGLSRDAVQLLPQAHDFQFQGFRQGPLREIFTFAGRAEATRGGTSSFTPFNIIFEGPTRIPGERRGP